MHLIMQLKTVCVGSLPCRIFISDFCDGLEKSSTKGVYIALRNLEYEYTALLGTLYRQRHAFRYLHRVIKALKVRVYD